MSLVADGHTHRVAAKMADVSQATMRNSLERCRKLVGVKKSVDLVAVCTREGWFEVAKLQREGTFS